MMMKRRKLTPARGLTLLELAIVMAVIAVLGTLAVPSMAGRLRAERLQTAAAMFAADIADARHEAARRGSALHIEPSHAGAAWCWSVTTHAGCSCAGAVSATTAAPGAPAAPTTPVADSPAAASCRLKTVPAQEHPGVALLQAQSLRLDPDGQASPGVAAVFGAGEQRLQVQVSRFGRARVCDPAGASHRVPAC